MTDEELDVLLMERFKAYEAGNRLPDGFKERLVGSLRRKRTVRRAWLLGLLCVMTAICAVIMHFSRSDVVRNDGRPSLMANTAQTNETAQVSYLMLLGYLRECFSRSRSMRRKEEE